MSTENETSRETGHSFADYFKRAASPMLVLHLLSEKPMYVYQMVQELSNRSNGEYTMSLLYPVLYRLTAQGYATEAGKQVSADNRVRQYYAITDTGRTYLQSISQEYIKLGGAVRRIMQSDS